MSTTEEKQVETPPNPQNQLQTTPIADLTQEELLTLKNNLHLYPKHKQVQILEILEVLAERKKAKRRRDHLLEFIMYVDPDYKIGKHHRKLATLLEDMTYGRKDRVMVNIAPRFGKSMLTSIYFPAWFIGNFPKKNIMMVSHTSDLAVDFGRKVRNIVDTDKYKEIFPGVELAADSKSAGRWSTNQDGSYFAVGIGGAIAGRGADLLCLAGESIVKTKDDGEKPIKSIVPGDLILTRYGWEEVTKKWLTIKKEYVTINTIEASLEHPFLTTRGWVKAGELSIGDKIVTLTFWRRSWLHISSLLNNLRAKPGKV